MGYSLSITVLLYTFGPQLILSNQGSPPHFQTKPINMLSSNTQLPAKRARIVKRPQGGQVFIRPSSTQAPPQTTGRNSRVDSAVSDLLNQLSQVSLGDGTEVQIASVDYDNIVNELSSRLAKTNFQVAAADDEEGYPSDMPSPPPPPRQRTKRGGADDDLLFPLRGLARSETRNYRQARGYDGQRNHASVISDSTPWRSRSTSGTRSRSRID